MKKNSIFLTQLITELLACKNLDDAKKLLFSLCGYDDLISKAVDFCIRSHEGQYRKSGEPYSMHPILVSCIVAYMGGDKDMLLCSLLHDVVEDTACTLDEIKKEFGLDVATLVEGLTKIVEIREDKLPSSNSNEKLTSAALSFRKMLLVSIKDVRALFVKLCDRLHNMLTLDALKPEKQKRIAQETLMVYAPISHRLGVSSIKNILEDLSFKYIFPDEYKKIDDYINEHKQELSLKLNDFYEKVNQILLKNSFTELSFDIEKRIKHHYSIYLKMQRKGISIEEVLDLLAIRIIVSNPLDCYMALGNLHINFNPLISRFKDYIALPKQNGYQTLHTTIFYNKSIFEVQIRTFDMHRTAEYGVAAHWKYKGGELLNPKLDWLSDLGKLENNNAEEIYEYAKDSLYAEDIAVYSPKGGIFTLPRGATALDYAYEIHTEIGLYAKSVYINKVKSPLLTELKNGDIVKIVVGDELKYRCSWLDSVKTGKARATIKQFCRQKIKEINSKLSIKILKSIFNFSDDKIIEILESENLNKKIHKISIDIDFLKEIIALISKKENLNLEKFEVIEQKFDNIILYSNRKFENLEFDYCCNPKRGDNIIGFKDNLNINVHHKLCNKANEFLNQDKEVVFVKWSNNAPHRYKLILNLENRKGSLADFLNFLARLNINLIDINVNKTEYGVSGNFFVISFEVSEDENLKIIEEKIRERYKIIDFLSLDDAYKDKG